jgi:hypothetical protein
MPPERPPSDDDRARPRGYVVIGNGVGAKNNRGRGLTQGHRATLGDAQPRMRLIEWRPVGKNTLYGLAVVELPSGLVIRDISIHEKGGKWWVSPSARPVLDGEGRHVTNHAGQKQYAAVIGWRDRDLADAFSQRLIELLRAQHLGAFDGEGAP